MKEENKSYILFSISWILIFTAGAFANYNYYFLEWKLKGMGELIWISILLLGMFINLLSTSGRRLK